MSGATQAEAVGTAAKVNLWRAASDARGGPAAFLPERRQG